MGLWLLLTRKFLSFVSIFSEQFHLQLVTILEQLEKKRVKDYKHNGWMIILDKNISYCVQFDADQ